MHTIVLVLLLQSQPFANAVQAADAAFEQRAYAQARDAYLQALAIGQREGNKQDTWRANFYLGLTTELLAEGTGDPALLSQAATYYEAAASIQPSPRISNNLALLRSRQGKHEEARTLFINAIAANDDHRALYEQNYAAFLHKLGQERDALTYYQHAAGTITPADELHRTIVQLSLRVDARELARYLTVLNRRGSPRVIPTALDGLRSEQAAVAHDDLVDVIAQALTQVPLDVDVPAQLRATKHPGAVQLASLLQERPPLSSLSWWMRGNTSSLDALRRLARALGRQSELQRRPEAEYYYRLAAESGTSPNEGALIDLASYYAGNKQRAALDELVRHFENTPHAANAYEFHRAAGVMYARLKQWSNPLQPVASALYQLEHAEVARQAMNTMATRPVPPDAGIYALLADAYTATGHEAAASRARLDAAQTFLSTGDKSAAREVLAPFHGKQLAAEDRHRYDQLLAALNPPLEKSVPFQPNIQAHPNDGMMAAMTKFGVPGDAHKRLDELVGAWNTKVTMWVAPDRPPVTTEGKAEVRWVLGGRYVEQRYSGVMMGAPFEAIGYTGYDAVKKQYWGTWMDSMSTSAMMSTGLSGPDGKTFTFTSGTADPMTGKVTTHQERITIIDDNNHKVETWAPGPDGKLYKMMEITYTRTKSPG